MTTCDVYPVLIVLVPAQFYYPVGLSGGFVEHKLIERLPVGVDVLHVIYPFQSGYELVERDLAE